MANTYKVLGQTGSSGNYGNGAQTLTATTNTNVYTVPAATTTVVIGFCISNRTSSSVYADVYVEKSDQNADGVYIVKGILVPDGSLYDFNIKFKY